MPEAPEHPRTAGCLEEPGMSGARNMTARGYLATACVIPSSKARGQQAEGSRLDEAIARDLRELGYGG